MMTTKSIKNFNKELDERLHEISRSGGAISCQDELKLIGELSFEIFENWIIQERWEDLVYAVPKTFDSSEPKELISRISNALVRNQDLKRTGIFWEGFIRPRIAAIRHARKYQDGVQFKGKTICEFTPELISSMCDDARWLVKEYQSALNQLGVDEQEKVLKWLNEI